MWVLQLIARCRQDHLHSSCDLIDFEVAREGVDYEDEIEFTPKPLVNFRLKKIQAMSLKDKQAITGCLCVLGYKVTHCGPDEGKEQQLECPLLIDFDVNAPPTPAAGRFGWNMYVSTGHIDSPETSLNIKSLRALSVVTDAQVFGNFDKLMTIVNKRQAFLKYVSSNLYFLWILELLMHSAQLYPDRKCFHVNRNLIASGGVCDAGPRADVDNENSALTGADNGQGMQPESVNVRDIGDNDMEDDLFGDPLHFSRMCKLYPMTSSAKRSVIPLLKQFSGRWRVHETCQIDDCRECDNHHQEEMLFTVCLQSCKTKE